MITPDTIIRTARKTVAIIIDDEARLIVRAPKKTPINVIERFVASKQRWIEKKQREKKEKKSQHLSDEGKLLYLGEHYAMGQTVKKLMPNGEYLSDVSGIRLIVWYKKQARKLLVQRLNFFADKMGVEYSSFSLSGARTRWGSCGAGQSINLTWRLIMCPVWVIDYVAVHELCHIVVKNHKKEFWQRVALYYPEYKAANEWLKNNGWILKKF